MNPKLDLIEKLNDGTMIVRFTPAQCQNITTTMLVATSINIAAGATGSRGTSGPVLAAGVAGDEEELPALVQKEQMKELERQKSTSSLNLSMILGS